MEKKQEKYLEAAKHFFLNSGEYLKITAIEMVLLLMSKHFEHLWQHMVDLVVAQKLRRV